MQGGTGDAAHTDESAGDESDHVPRTAIAAAKHELRARLRRRRAELAERLDADPQAMAAAVVQQKAVADRLAWWAMVRGAGVAGAYASYGNEPSTSLLLEALRASSLRVLLPVMGEQGELAWSPYTDASDLVLNERGVPEPSGPRYGAHAVGGVDLIVVPALAVDEDGYRLGQGAGFYDRALTRLRPDVPVIALLHDDEVLPSGAVPHEEHDVRVTHVCTPTEGLRAVGTDRP